VKTGHVKASKSGDFTVIAQREGGMTKVIATPEDSYGALRNKEEG